MSEASSPYSDLTGLAGPTAFVPVRGGALDCPVVTQDSDGRWRPSTKKEKGNNDNRKA
jgi:hypothetical protein